MDYEEYAKKFCEMHFMKARRKAEAEGSLSPRGEDGVLLCIVTAQDPVLAKDICRMLELSPGRVTNILNVLEKRGYIAKEQSEEDRRKVYIRLTEKGREHIVERYQVALRYLTRIFETLGEADTKAYFRITSRIHEITEELKEQPSENIH